MMITMESSADERGDNNVEPMLALIMMIQDCLIEVNPSCPQHITLRKVTRLNCPSYLCEPDEILDR